MEDKISIKNKYDAKNVVDIIFDKGFFREDVCRDDMNAVENLIAYLFQSHESSVERCLKLVKRCAELNKGD